MSEPLIEVLDALEKPLKFASRKDFSNIGKVKALDQLVYDLTLKALSLQPSDVHKEEFLALRDMFSHYESLDTESRKELIENSLATVAKLRKDCGSSAIKQVDKSLSASERGDVKQRAVSPQAEKTTLKGREIEQIPVKYVRGVGPRIAEVLRKKGVASVYEALFYFPRRYEDRRKIRNISQLHPGERETISGQIVVSDKVRTSRRSLYQVVISDGTGTIKLVWFQFSERYLRATYKKGLSVILSGEVTLGYRDELQIIHPKPEDIEVIEEGEGLDEQNVHFNRIVPVYPLAEGIGQRRMRKIMKSVVDDYSQSLPNFIPEKIKSKRKVMEFAKAVVRVHFPDDQDQVVEFTDRGSVYESLPHKTVSYCELFLMQLGIALKKRDVTQMKGIVFSPSGVLTKKLLSRFSFDLTSAQLRVISEIERDMRSEIPMNRMLQGDVGSGKTVVALISILKAVESGYQAVLMAPTEILAEQHLVSIFNYLKGMRLHIVFLKSSLSKSEKGAYYKALSNGQAQIAVGTHALIQEKVDFKNLGLVVIDEQHRFGVMQRAELIGKGNRPDVLVMTATPIPRTLALTVHGDLDVSVLDELPPGRREIRTKVYYDQKRARERAHSLVEREIKKGRQAYVVYPMIEESENSDFKGLKDATQMAERFQNEIFPNFRVGLLHGRMKPEEKDIVMRKFISNDLDILVSTTVIEVGVDVPNATVMVVENAERFGLTQLHQLRGRVGRGKHDSYCVLLSGFQRSEDAERRLSVMERTRDGFEIAEADLAIRGPGDFLGTKQSGLPEFKFANIMRDTKILGEAREDAFHVVKKDPRLSNYPELLKEVSRKWKNLLEFASIS